MADDVTVTFGGVKALHDVRFSASPGIVTGLIGPNGAGKTTLLNALSGFAPLTAGRVVLDGEEITGLGPHRTARRGVARTFQAVRLFKSLSVLENLMVPALQKGFSPAKARARGHELLEWLGLSAFANQSAGNLAYGHQRWVGIARSLALAPRYLLLDEPAAGLTGDEASALSEAIAHIPARFDCGVVLVEHNMDVVMSACSYLHVLANGRNLAHGSPAEMQDNALVRDVYLGEPV